MAPRPGPTVEPVDPFDLPDWVGEGPVTWQASTSLAGSHRVSGELRAGPGARVDCDVLACDLAYPQPVLQEKWRRESHSAWMRDEVLLLEKGRRLTLAAPGTTVDADLVLEAVRRLAKAVGAAPERFTVTLRL